MDRARSTENAVSVAVLAALALLPLVEIVARLLPIGGIPGSISVVQHLTLVVTFLGAMLAARDDRLLALSTTHFLPERFEGALKIFTSAVGAGLTLWLAQAGWELVQVEREFVQEVAWGLTSWMFVAIIPIGFAGMALRLVWKASEHWPGRLLAACGFAIPAAFTWWGALEQWDVVTPGVALIVLSTALGMPIFAAIGGASLLLFWYDMTPLASVPAETYRLAASPMLPAIPLFTLGGYVLAEGGAGKRLTRLFRAMVGWMPGGLAIVVTLTLAFFTPLTGASGVTILSMGGLLLPILTEAKYPERTSLGLVTVSGSIGLLFPPSLPVILYAFYAEQPLEKLFLGGLLPGFLLVAVVAAWAARRGVSHGARTTPFQAAEARAALWEAKYDLLLPVVVLGGIFGGFTTLVEAAAVTTLYAFLIERFVFKTLTTRGDLPRIAIETATLIGGFMIILCVAMGFTNWLIYAEIPTRTLEWVQAHIESKWLFLLALNIFLIVVGALMDIYSAIIVVVPLITPIGAAYGVDPVHLGIIFLANMELGYMMPPMGENLFLSAYRFDKPLTEIYRSTLPFMLILLAAVLLITYWPAFTLTLANFHQPGP
ncbi:MAG: TRAP transporter large permease subunit [Acidobacteria bacterium]|nr:TRAP transporter large permease subunit [Acidobacteriota bacterium]